MSCQRAFASVIITNFVLFLSATLPAATVTWDTATTAGFQAGSGTWSTGGQFWSSNGTTLSVWTNSASGDHAVFANSSGSASTITLTTTGAQTVGNMTFSNTGYTITAGTLNFGTAGGTVTSTVADATINSILGGSVGLTKAGAGTLILGGANVYTGNTTLSAGTLTLAGGSNRLPTGSTVAFTAASTLNLGANAQTLAAVTVSNSAGFTSTIRGSGGSLTLNGATDLQWGPGGDMAANVYNMVVNLSALSSFTYNSSANVFRVGFKSGATNSSTTTGSSIVTLATSNSITANSLAIGDVSSNQSGGQSTLHLGAVNAIKVGSIGVAYSGRSNATLDFNAAGSTATFRNTDGSSAMTAWNIGRADNFATSTWTASTDLSSGTIDAAVTTMTIGNAALAANARGGTTNGSFTMGAGTLTASTINLGMISGGVNSLSGSHTAAGNGTFTLNSAAGVVSAGTLTFATNTISATTANAPRSTGGTLNLTAGLLNATSIALGPQTGTATDSESFVWSAGTLANISGTNLSVTGIPFTLTTSAAHTLNITGTSATFDAASPLTGTGGLTKAGTGTLTLTASSNYSGATTIAGGTVIMGHNAALGSSAGSLSISNGATLELNGKQLGAKVVAVSGSGVDGNGAIVNNGAANTNALQSVTMNGATTLGGIGRFDIRGGAATLNMGGFKLTKTGTNQFSLVGIAVSNPGSIDLNQGVFSIETSTTMGGTSANVLTVSNSATLQMYQLATAVPWSLVVNPTGGSFLINNSSAATHNTWSGPVTLDGPLTVTGNAGYVATISGNIAGTGGITKRVANQLTLSGSNGYTGVTTIEAGTLQFAKANSLYGGNPANWTEANIQVAANATLALSVGGTGEFTASDVQTISGLGSPTGGFANGARLGLDTTNAGGSFSYGNVLADTNTGTYSLALVKLGTGSLALTASNTYTGGTFITAGVLDINSDAALGAVPVSPTTNITFNGAGTLRAAANLSLDVNRNMTIAASSTATLNPGGFSLTVPGALVASASASSLYLSGAGTLNLTAATGSTAGILELKNGVTANISGPFNAINKFVVGNAGGGVTLNWSGTGGLNTVNPAGNFFAIGDQSSNNVLNVTGGSLYINGSTVTPYNKFFIGNGVGTASTGNAVNVSGGTVTVAAGTPLQVGGVDNYTANTTSGSLNVSGGLMIVAGSSTDTITLGNHAASGTGTTAAGVLNLSSGTLATNRQIKLGLAGSGAVTGTLNFNGGVLQAAGTQSAWITGLTAANILSGGAFIDSQGFNNITIPQAFAGAGALTKLGSGDLTLTGTNTYAGGTNISSGRLVLNAAAAKLGSGTVGIAAGAELYSNAAVSLSNAFSIAGDGNGGLDSQPRGALRLDNGTIAAAGSVVLLADASIGSYNDGAGVINAPITESGGSFMLSINKAAPSTPGTIILGGSNTYTGGTHVYNGVVRPTNNGAFGSGTITIDSGARLNPLSNRTIANALAVSGSAGVNTIHQGGSTTTTYNGSLTLGTATQVKADGGSAMYFNGPVTLGGNVLTFVSDSGTANNNSSINGNIAADGGGLTKQSTGMLILGGSNLYTGLTTINGGNLQLANSDALAGGGNVTFTGGALQYTASNTGDYAARIVNSTAAMRIDTNGQSVTYAGALAASNTAGLTKLGAGTLVLAASNLYGGLTTLSGGTLGLADPGAIPSGGSLAFTGGALQHTAANTVDYAANIVNSTAAIQIDTNGQSVTYAGVLAASNTAGLTKLGEGLLALNAANLHTGTTTVTAGTLQAGDPAAFGPVANPLSVGASGIVDLNAVNLQVGPLGGSGIISDFSASAGTTTLTVNQVGTTTFSGSILEGAAKNVALVRSGAGTLVLTGSSNYTGGTTVNGTGTSGCILLVTNSAALGQPGLGVTNIVNNGTLQLAGDITINQPIGVAGSGDAFYGALQNQSGNNTWAGTVTLNGGRIGGIAGNLTLSGPIVNGSNGFLAVKTNSTTSTITISGSGSYTGATNHYGGTVILDGGNDRLPGSTLVTLGSTNHDVAILNLNGWNQTLGGLSRSGTGVVTVTNSAATTSTLSLGGGDVSSSYPGLITGNIILVKIGTGSLTLSNTANSYTGGMTLQNGTLVVGSATAMPGGLTLAGGTLDLAGTSPTIASIAGVAGTITNYGAGPSTLTVSNSAVNEYAGSMVDGPTQTVALTKAGSSVLTLSGTNTYTGNTNVNAGVLIFANTNAVPNFSGKIFVNSGGVLAATGAYATVNDWLNNSSGKINTSSSGVLAFLGDSSETVVMTGYNSLSLGATGSATYDGALTPALGTYRLGGAGGTLTVSSSLGSGAALSIAGGGTPGKVILTNTDNNSFSGGITIASGGTLQGTTATMQGNVANSGALVFDQDISGNFPGALSGAGTLYKQNVGLLNLTGASTYGGAINVNGGTLAIDPAGSMNFGGAFTISGSDAALNVNGLLSRTGNSSLTVRDGGTVNFSGTGAIQGSGGAIIIGNAGSGVFNVTAGSLLLNPANTNGFGIGFGSGATGVLNITGGTVTTGNNVFLVGYNSNTTSGTVHVSGGGVLSLGNSSQTFIGGGASGSGTYGTGTLNIENGGRVFVGTSSGAVPNNALYLGGYGGTGILNLNAGGLLNLARPIYIRAGTGSQLNLNGGTLQAAFASTDLLTTSPINVQDGGAVIDTQGNATTIAQALLGTGSGGLTKYGAGTLTLSASNSYTGGTTVAAGTLKLGHSAALGIPSGGTLAVVNPGAALDLNGIHLGTMTGVTLVISGTGTGANSGALVNSSAAELIGSGARYITLAGDTSIGSNGKRFDLSFSGGSVDGGGFSLTKVGSSTVSVKGEIANLANLIVNNGTWTLEAQTALDGAAVTVNSGATLQIWNASTSLSYSNSLAINGATVQSTNAPAGGHFWTGPVTLGAGGATFGGNYGLTISGDIGGSTGLTKTGSGTLTLTGSNTYAGDTVVRGFNGTMLVLSSTSGVSIPGNLQIGSTGDVANNAYVKTTAPNQFGPNSVLIFNRGAGVNGVPVLELLGNNQTVAGVTILSNTGGTYIENTQTENGYGPAILTINNSTDYTYGSVIRDRSSGTSGNLGLTKAGTATQTLSGTGITYTGPTTINAGTLRLSGATGFASVVTLADVAGAVLDVPLSMPVAGLAGGGTTGGNVTLGSTATLTVNQAIDTTYAGAISGGGGLTKTGVGALFLAGVNSYSGTTTVSGGVLTAASTAALPGYATPGRNIVNSGATLAALSDTGSVGWSSSNIDTLWATATFNAGSYLGIDTSLGDFTYTSNVALPNAGFNKLGANLLILSGTNAFGGGTIVTAGTLQTATASAIGSGPLTVNATLDLNGFDRTAINLSGGTGGVITDSLAVAGTTTLSLSQTAATAYAGSIQDGPAGRLVALAVSGSNNILSLSGSSNYTGGTTISGLAQVTVLNNAALGTGPVVVGDLAANTPYLNLGNGVTLTNPLTLASAPAVIGSSGRASLQVLAGNSATYNGAMTLSGTNLSQLTSAGTMTVQGTVGGSTGTYFLRGSGTGLMQSTITIVGTVAKTDGGTWTISSTNNTWNNTTVSVGTLKLGANDAFPTSTLVTMGQGDTQSPTWDLAGFNQTIGGLTWNSTGGTKTVTNSTATPDILTINTVGDQTYGGRISGPLSLVIGGTGSQTLSGTANAFTGGVTVQSGTLKLGASNALTATNGAMTVNGGTLDLGGFSPTVGALGGTAGTISTSGTGSSTLTVNSAVHTTFAGVIDNGAGTVGLTKTGVGTLFLTGANTYSGTTTITNGALDATDSGSLPGASNLVINGGVYQSNGTFARPLGTGADQVKWNSGGFSARGGQLTVSLAGGPDPLVWNSTTNSISGSMVLNSSTADSQVAVTHNFDLNNASRTITVNSGVGGDYATLSGALSGTGASGINKAGTGRLVLSGSNTYEGTTTITQGTIAIGGVGAIPEGAGKGNVNSYGATLDLNGQSPTLAAVNGVVNITNTAPSTTATLSIGGGDQGGLFGGTIADSGTGLVGLTKTGTGTMTLAIAGSYSGATDIQGGTLRLGDLAIPAGGIVYHMDAQNLASFTAAGGGTPTDGSLLSAWADTTANGQVFSQATSGNQPSYSSTGLNGKPAVTFVRGGSNTTNDWMATGGTASVRAVFIVNANTNPADLGGIWGSSGADKGIRSSGMSWASANNADWAWNGAYQIDGIGGSNFGYAGNNYILFASSTATSSLTTAIGDYWHSGSYPARGFSGAIGEVLLYDTTLDAAQQAQVNAYLMGKWFGSTTDLIPDSSAVTVAAGSVFDLNGHAETIGSLAGAGDVLLSGGTLTAGANHASTTFSGAVGGTGGLTKSGSGTLTLTGTNAFAGALTVNAGALQLMTLTNHGTGAISLGGAAPATLRFIGGNMGTSRAIDLAGNATLDVSAASNDEALAFNGAISGTDKNLTLAGGNVLGGEINAAITLGAGSLTKAGSGAWYLNQANSYSGGTTIEEGNLVVGAADRLGSGTLAFDGAGNGVLDIVGDTAFSFTGAVALNAGGTIRQTSTADSTFSGAITGTGLLTKTGSGTLILSGSNTYSGGTIVDAGTLVLNTADSILDGTSLTVGNVGAFPAPIVPAAAPVGMPLASAGPGVAPVPEPGTLALLVAGAAAVAWRIRRRRGDAKRSGLTR